MNNRCSWSKKYICSCAPLNLPLSLPFFGLWGFCSGAFLQVIEGLSVLSSELLLLLTQGYSAGNEHRSKTLLSSHFCVWSGQQAPQGHDGTRPSLASVCCPSTSSVSGVFHSNLQKYPWTGMPKILTLTLNKNIPFLNSLFSRKWCERTSFFLFFLLQTHWTLTRNGVKQCTKNTTIFR